MEHFVPVDLLHIVLSKLPVKSLLRLRCVSKLWLNIIDSSYFINMHLTQTAKTSSNTIIVPCKFMDKKSMPMYAFEFDNEIKARKIDPPVVGYNINFVHTCNGLISLLTKDSFVIWNPATHKHRVVDKVKVDDDDGGRCIYNGFGYDHKTEDYKVVMFGKKLKEGKKSYIVYIYSLKTGSWRKLGTTNHEIMGALTLSVYANGAIHWIHSYVVRVEPIFEMKRNMVALDLTTEKWVPRTMPPRLSEKPATNESWSLCNHHGSLYASCCVDETSILHLWVIKYQGTKTNTWTKLFTIKGNGSFGIRITPLWSLKKTSRHQVLINETQEFQLYDIEERTTEAFDVYDVSGSGVSGIWKSIPCYETLVSI